MPIDIKNDTLEIALAKLKARENTLKQITKLAKLASWEIDLKTNISIWSDQSYETYKFNKKTTKPTLELFLSLLLPEYVESTKETIKRGIETGEIRIFYCKAKRTDGVIIDLLINGQVIYDDENKPIKIIGTTQDITEQRVKDNKLLQQSRLAQMGELLSMIIHQWKQPLAAISAMNASLNLQAQLKKLDNENVSEVTENINKCIQHLSSTIDDFRDFFGSKRELKKITFDEILESILSIIELSITNKKIKIIKDLNSKDSFVSYPNEIKQVVLNLIKNAEDALLEKDIAKPVIKINTYSKTNKHILTISDNAGGVKDNVLNKIFDPYFSTKLEKNGTGLGLYMSRVIIEDHCSGTLTITNNEDGAIFKIELSSMDMRE